MSTPMRKGELDLGLHLSDDEIHEEEAPMLGMGRKRATQQAASSWLLNTSSIMIGSGGGSMDSSSAVEPVGMESSTKATNKIDPLELSIAPHVPTINLNLNLSSVAPHVNQLPPKRQAPSVPDNTWSAKPFERPLLERVGRKDPQLGPFILESSQVVSWEYAEKQREAAANNKRMPVEEEVGSGSGSAAKRRYRWPAKTVANINEKIEQLKKEALRKPDERRRSLSVIEAEIDQLQGKKEQIHARVSGQL